MGILPKIVPVNKEVSNTNAKILIELLEPHESSRYVRMVRTMMSIIKRVRMPPYLHKTSNHVYTVWQHLVLLVLRQYERKSYRRFIDFLQECTGVQQCLGLSAIPHYTTLQKASTRLKHGMLQKAEKERFFFDEDLQGKIVLGFEIDYGELVKAIKSYDPKQYRELVKLKNTEIELNIKQEKQSKKKKSKEKVTK